MRFTLRQLEYFAAAAEAGSISMASEQVHISQPSISAAIASLEGEFGVQLFIRHHAQGLSLTPQGRALLVEAKALLLQAKELAASATSLSSKVAGVVSVGCLATLYPLIIPELVHAFKERYPAARVEAIAGDHAGLLDQLSTGKISLLLTYDLGIAPDFEFVPMAVLPPFAFVAEGHEFAQRDSVSLLELSEYPFLLLDLPVSRDYFLSLFHRSGVAPQIGGRFEHMEVIRSLVARGGAFGLANARPKNHASLDGRSLAYLTLEGEPEPLVQGIVLMKAARRVRSVEAFVEVCRSITRDSGLPGTIGA